MIDLLTIYATYCWVVCSYISSVEEKRKQDSHKSENVHVQNSAIWTVLCGIVWISEKWTRDRSEPFDKNKLPVLNQQTSCEPN